MILHRYIEEVRGLLRDQTYTEDDIIAALNTVVKDINSSGRYRFHEATYTLNLTANNYTYPIPSNLQTVKVMIYDAGTNNQCEVYRKSEVWQGSPMIPATTGNTPIEYAPYANNWYIYPIPNATMANNNITVLHDRDLSDMLSPADDCGLPERHTNVAVYGACFQLNPNLIVGTEGKEQTIAVLYGNALRNMKIQEHWQSSYTQRLRPGRRWRNVSSWGHKGGIYQ